MESVKSVSDQIAVADCQLTAAQIQEASEAGFQSILNLRSHQEEGFVPEEQQQAEAAGLTYVHIPVTPDNMSDQVADEVLQSIDSLPKPILTHCKSGMRSGAMALMHLATRENLTPEQAMQKGKQIGFDCDSHPQMKQFFTHYVSTHSQAA
jgi:uncharacterized protein (TIGR01244 family)